MSNKSKDENYKKESNYSGGKPPTNTNIIINNLDSIAIK